MPTHATSSRSNHSRMPMATVKAGPVAIQRDSSLAVTETINVRAEGDRIRHGIYRDFPTRYRARNGGRMRVGFSFEGATLDGQPVPASTDAISNGVRIKLGDPDSFVEPGEHRYVIRYRTTRQLGRGQNSSLRSA